MRREERRAFIDNRNSFGQHMIIDLGFNKSLYHMTKEEFENAVLPDNKGYGIKADDYTRTFVNFKEWDDPEDCYYIVFDVINGKKCNFSDVSREVYQACLYFVEIENWNRGN